MSQQQLREEVLRELRGKWRTALGDERRDPFPVPPITLKQRFNEIASTQPDRPYIQYRGACLTYGACNDLARRWANGLRALGLRKGDRAMICVANSPAPVVLSHACFKVGVVVICTNPLESTDDLAAKIADARPSAIVVDRYSCANVVKIIREQKRLVERLLYPADEPLPSLGACEGMTLEELAKLGGTEEPDVDISPEDTVVLQYTGGTTGIMKGCRHCSRGYLASSMARKQAFGAALSGCEDKTLVSLPMGHGSGFTTSVVAPLMTAGSIVLVDHLKPSMEDVLEAIVRYRPTVWPTVPLLLNRFVASPDLQACYDLSSVRLVFSGAAPLPESTAAWFRERGQRIAEAYGLSEMVNIVTMSPLTNHSIGNVGVPFGNVDVLLVDNETGDVVTDHDVSGEIIVRSPSMMKGYWGDPEGERNQIRDGWLHTGDMGAFDENGLLRITGRKKSVIIVSGFNVYPNEVAASICKHPSVSEAWVVGVPDDQRGEVPAAVVVRAEGSTLSADELIAYCREHMTRYKVPRRVCFVQALPVMCNGKPDDQAIREIAKAC